MRKKLVALLLSVITAFAVLPMSPALADGNSHDHCSKTTHGILYGGGRHHSKGYSSSFLGFYEVYTYVYNYVNYPYPHFEYSHTHSKWCFG